jgi:SAM-dependent methyltransferase
MLPAGQAPVKQEFLPRRLGGHQVLAIELFHLLQSCFEARAKITILDLVCGTGESSRMIASVCRTRGYEASIRAVHFDEATLAVARERSADYPQISFELMQMGAWTSLPAESVDVITCCFGLNAFPLQTAVSMFEAIDRATRTAWMVLDLKRTRMLTVVAEAVRHWTPGDAEDWQNAGLLTQQAFSGRELKNLAFHAGVSDYSWRNWFLHQVMIRHK